MAVAAAAAVVKMTLHTGTVMMTGVGVTAAVPLQCGATAAAHDGVPVCLREKLIVRGDVFFYKLVSVFHSTFSFFGPWRLRSPAVASGDRWSFGVSCFVFLDYHACPGLACTARAYRKRVVTRAGTASVTSEKFTEKFRPNNGRPPAGFHGV